MTTRRGDVAARRIVKKGRRLLLGTMLWQSRLLSLEVRGCFKLLVACLRSFAVAWRQTVQLRWACWLGLVARPNANWCFLVVAESTKLFWLAFYYEVLYWHLIQRRTSQASVFSMVDLEFWSFWGCCRLFQAAVSQWVIILFLACWT